MYYQAYIYDTSETNINKVAQESSTESSCSKHLLEVGVFSVLNQLQQNSLCGGEVSSALLQSGQSKQTVRLAVEGDAKAVTHTHTHTVSTHTGTNWYLMQVITMLSNRKEKKKHRTQRYLLDETASATIWTSIPFSSRSNVVHCGKDKKQRSFIQALWATKLTE